MWVATGVSGGCLLYPVGLKGAYLIALWRDAVSVARAGDEVEQGVIELLLGAHIEGHAVVHSQGRGGLQIHTA
jgi:hypothetical protein